MGDLTSPYLMMTHLLCSLVKGVTSLLLLAGLGLILAIYGKSETKTLFKLDKMVKKDIILKLQEIAAHHYIKCPSVKMTNPTFPTEF